MRRVAVLLVLLGVMLALQLLRAAPVSAARDPMTLAAIGFVLLASFTLAELGSSLTLPRVTGYILAGVALGPSAANVLSVGVVQEMRMFNALALGLIATGAGLELDLGEIRRVLRTLLGTIVVKVVLSLLLVGGAFVTIALSFPGLGLGTRPEIYALGLVLAVLAIGTSPSISLAVKTETGAKGRLMDLVLGAAVLKDLVIVIGLAIAVAVSHSWLSPDQVSRESWVTLVGKELGGSLLAGSVLGALLVAYIRFVKAEMLLFVAAMILVVSELGRTLHLDLLLIFITAGFVVRNFSRHEHELMPAVQMVSLPIFIVFFTIAGASVDLRSTLEILPLALTLAVARAIAFVVASRAGGRIGRERAFIRSSAWLGYLPQAGVTLGLLGLAAQQLPTLADRLRSIGMAGVAINLLLGPIALKRVLKRAGEIRNDSNAGSSREPPQIGPDPESSTVVPPPVDQGLRELSEMASELESQQLADLVVQLHDDLSRRIDDFRHEQLEPWVRSVAGPLEKVLDEIDDDAGVIDALHSWTAVPHTEDLPRRAMACYELFSEIQTVLRRVEIHVVVPLEASHRKVLARDGAAVRFRKRLQNVRLFLHLGRSERRVPARVVARLTLEARMAGFALSTLSAWSEAQASLLTELERARSRGADRLQTRHAVSANLSRFLVNFEHHARAHLLKGVEDLTRSLAIAGGPALPTARIRLSKQEPIVTRRLARLRADPAAWKPVLEGKQAELRAKLEIERLLLRLRRSLDETVLRPAQTSLQIARSVLFNTRGRLSEIGAGLQGTQLADAKRAGVLEQLRGAFPAAAQRRLGLAATRFRSAATVGSVAREIRVSIEALPAIVLVPKVRTLVTESSPATYAVQPVLLRARVEQILIETLFPALDEQLRDVFAEMAVTGARIREAIEICEHAIDAAVSDAAPDVQPRLAHAFDRALTRLDEQLRTLANGLESTAVGVRGRAEAALTEMGAVCEGNAETAAAAPLAANFWRNVGRHKPSLVGWAQRTALSLARLMGDGQQREQGRGTPPTAVDANAVHQQVVSIVDTAHLPPDYARLWPAEPVREHKFFWANRETLRELLESERSSLERQQGSALLVGRAGSGRTSLLNLCEVELSAPRVLRPEPLEGRRSAGIMRSLAAELGLGDRRVDLTTALREVRTTVLIDDLEHWFTPDASGIAALSSFLELVVATDDRVFWLVAVEQSSLALLEEALPIRPAFTHLVSILPLSAKTLSDFVESRHAMSQRSLVYPSTVTSRMLGRFRFGDARGVFFRMLARESDGNLSAASLLWLRAARMDADGVIAPEPYLDAPLIASTVAQLPARQLAVLSHLARFGPLNEAELSRYLELPEPEVARHAHWFVAAGLLTRDSTQEARLTIATRIKPTILGALRNVGTIR